MESSLTVSRWPQALSPSEDGNIMRLRAEAEQFFTGQLTDDERADWLDFLTTDPPQDYSGHYYTVTPPTAFNQTQVLLPTAYAWSVLFGLARFETAKPRRPVRYTFPTLTQSVVAAKTTQIFLRFAIGSDLSHVVGLLLYTTPIGMPMSEKNAHYLKPTGRRIPEKLAETLDCTAAILAKWGTTGPAQLNFSFHMVGLGGRLKYSQTITSVSVANG